ncbi:phosphatase PAP2 family protein [Dactylosporangium sp. CA-233914]|uniref:phosphatase PAP2 family protein n=1 Tax=Dactylosporangium sp. CA-233914 TaxID=3239934 RepID=UPI003D8DDF45
MVFLAASLPDLALPHDEPHRRPQLPMAVLAVAFGPALLATAVLVAAVGRSRVRLRDHTPAQVVAGTILGVLTTGLAFALLR